jgi:hypothetical protein
MSKLLKKAKNEMAFAKLGMYGFEGSGKTYTASQFMIGLYGYLKEKKPCAFIDTETGSDFVLPLFKKAGIELLVAKTRSFKDLLDIIDEAEKECYGLIIDSLTHVWRDLMESYMKKLNRRKLYFQDWNQIKPEWHRYSDKFVNSKLHVVACGRAGYNWDYFEAEDGSKELEKTSTKMKAEGEFTFEPSLVIEMERVPIVEEGKDKKGKTTRKYKVGAGWYRRAHVLKDRFDIIDGEQFDNPTFSDFEPFVKNLNLGGEHLGVEAERDSQELFEKDGSTEWSEKKKEVKIVLEEIEAELIARYPGHSGKDKVAKIALINHVFGTKSWTAVCVKNSLSSLIDILNDEESLKTALEVKDELFE